MLLYVVTALIVLFLVLPVLIIIPMSFSSSRYIEFPPPDFSTRWYDTFFGSKTWTTALMNSIVIGIATTILALILGLLIAEGLNKSHFKGKSFITELFMMPMLVPGIIVGISLFKFESEIKISGTLTGLIIAHTVLAIPFVVRTVLASLSGLNPNYELAAQNLGANKFQTFMKVTFPIIKPAIFSGAMFAFATSFDEIVVSQFICGTRVKTLPKVIWVGLNQQLDPTITSIATIMITLITIIMVLMYAKDIFGKKNKGVPEEMIPEED